MKKLFVFLVLLSATGCLVTRDQASEAEERKALQGQVATLQKSKADQDQQIQTFESQSRALNGRLEELDHNQKQNEQKISDLQQRLQSTEEKLRQYDAAFVALEQEVVNLKKNPIAEVSKKSAFDEAEEQFSEKNFKKAITLFQKFREVSPKDKNNPTATFRIGQCFQELGMTKEARVFYEEVLERYPDSRMAKQAQTRLAKLKK